MNDLKAAMPTVKIEITAFSRGKQKPVILIYFVNLFP
jgi:hypothetical protein